MLPVFLRVSVAQEDAALPHTAPGMLISHSLHYNADVSTRAVQELDECEQQACCVHVQQSLLMSKFKGASVYASVSLGFSRSVVNYETNCNYFFEVWRCRLIIGLWHSTEPSHTAYCYVVFCIVVSY